MTVYVKPAIRQALKIAAARHNTTIAEMLQEAIAATLDRYSGDRKG